MSPLRTDPAEGPTGLPQVLFVLQQIRDRALVPDQRLAMLRALKDRVEALLADCPPPRCLDRGRTPDAVQSLAAAWCGNLRHLLNELGHPRAAGQARYAVYREWVVRQILKDLGRAVEHGARAGAGAPPGTWRALHDLFFYLDGRDEAGGSAGLGRFSPDTEYKRLLLIGALGEARDPGPLLLEAAGRLRDWAVASTLRRDVRILGESGVLRLDLGADAPPRRSRPGDAQPYHGWVLEPVPAFSALLERGAPGQPSLAVAA